MKTLDIVVSCAGIVVVALIVVVGWLSIDQQQKTAAQQFDNPTKIIHNVDNQQLVSINVVINDQCFLYIVHQISHVVQIQQLPRNWCN